MRLALSCLSQAGYHFGCAGRHISKAACALSCSVAFQWVAFCAVCLAALLLFSGCSFRMPKISIPGGGLMSPVEVQAPKDAGKPATVDTSSEQSGLKLPKDSTLIVTETAATPATETAPARPAVKVYKVKLSSDSEWFHRAQSIAASTGTVDTSLAKHRIDVAERRWLLWAGIIALLAGLVVRSLLPAWPSLSSGLLLGGAALLGAWKFSEIPWWISLVIVGVVLALIAGYKRAEWDKDGDGRPDLFQKKTT